MLSRGLGSIQIQLISIGGIIGSAYFLGVGSLVAENGPSVVIAFLLGGLIAWFVAMAMGELCVSMPRDGSFVSQSSELLGKHWAAGVGWSYWFNWCAYIPSEMIAGGMILNTLFPQISVIVWASLFAALITAMNLVHIKYFGTIESGLSLLKVAAMLLFSAAAITVVGQESSSTLLSRFEFSSRASFGSAGFLVTMVLVLVNFQGTELIALSSSETKDPQNSIPRAARNVAMRAILLYAIPLTLLILIFPWREAKVEQSIFSEALLKRGFPGLATFLKLVIITAALSCANSGLYGAVRSLYGLGKEGLAPSWVTTLSPKGVPAYATWLTIAVCWSFLPLYLLFEGTHFYTWLLSVSGFTGAMCWISITLCQIKFRTQLRRQGKEATMVYRMPWFPALSWISLVAQILCVCFIAWHPTLRSSLYLGIPAILIPIIISFFREKRLLFSEAKSPSP